MVRHYWATNIYLTHEQKEQVDELGINLSGFLREMVALELRTRNLDKEKVKKRIEKLERQLMLLKDKLKKYEALDNF